MYILEVAALEIAHLGSCHCVVDLDVHKYHDSGGDVYVPGCVVDLDVHKYHDTGGDVEGAQS